MTSKSTHLAIYQYSQSLTTQYRHVIAKLAESFDLTGAQLGTLCMLEPNQSVPMKHICINLGCDASNVTGIIDRLVQKGLIQREDSTKDRRVKMIHLTEKGTHLRQLAIAHLEQADAHGIHLLTPEEREYLATLLQKATRPGV